MLSTQKVARFLLLPELKLTAWNKEKVAANLVDAEKCSKFEVCPKCATPSSSGYDSRTVIVKDAPVRGSSVKLRIKKRRFYCKACRKPFTEPVRGISKGQRTTQRYRRTVLWACENFSDLKRVRKTYRCSNGFIYQTLYEQIELRLKQKLNYAWPTTIGIDEHFFTRRRGRAEFVTVFTDFSNKRIRELAFGKLKGEVIPQIAMIEGRENVRNIVLDMSDTYRSLAKEFFPNARLIADKFHVLRLVTPALNKYRVAVTGDKRTLPIRKLLLRSRHKLLYYERAALDRWLSQHSDLNEVYRAKEALYSFYRIKGLNRARHALTKLTDALAHSKLKELKRLRRTLMAWREEILAYFETRLTNARTEGFNNVAKLVQKRAYGYRSFENYRLRLLNACL
jgi:transposase